MKLKNLDDMDRFPEKYHIPKLYQDQVNYLNNLVIPNEIQVVIKSLPIKESPVMGHFNSEFYQT